jgi:hypothetical protein
VTAFTDPLDQTLESRGDRQVVLSFIDDRLRGLFIGVWRSLPAAALDAIYAMLGDGEHVLQVTDHTPANRPGHALGEAVRFGAHIKVALDYFNLDDMSDPSVKRTIAHELAHVTLGHLGAPRPEQTDIPARLLLAAAPRTTGIAYAKAELPHEKAADLQADVWGYPEPRKVTRRKAGQHISIYTTRR